MAGHPGGLDKGYAAAGKLGRIYGSQLSYARPPASVAIPSCTLPEDVARRISVARAWIRANQLRGRYLDPALFADPAWSILLDLYLARLTKREVSISSACIAADVPPTTALRWLKTLTDSKWLSREPDPTDHRRIMVTMPADVAECMDALMDAAMESDRKLGLERMHVTK